MSYNSKLKSLTEWSKSPILKNLKNMSDSSKEYGNMSLLEAMKSNNTFGIFALIQFISVGFTGSLLLHLSIKSRLGLDILGEAIKEINSSIDLDSLEILGKTGWDWISLLIIPAILGIGGFLAQDISKRGANKRRHQEILDSYFHEISSIILDDNWPEVDKKGNLTHGSSKHKNILAIVRAKTLAVIPSLNKDNLEILIQFLGESRIISIVPLRGIDLSNLKLKDIDFRNADISFADFSGAELENVNFSGARIQESNFMNSILKNICFSESDLKNSKFQFSQIDFSNFSKANLSKTSFEHADLQKVDFSNSDLTNSLFIMLYRIEKISFRKSVLSGAFFDSNILKDIAFCDADLDDASFSNVEFNHVDFSNSNFRKASYKDIVWNHTLTAS